MPDAGRTNGPFANAGPYCAVAKSSCDRAVAPPGRGIAMKGIEQLLDFLRGEVTRSRTQTPLRYPGY